MIQVSADPSRGEKIAILHYTAPPVVGGVEAVLQAHTEAFLQFGYPVTVVAGRGEVEALPPGAELLLVPEMDTQHPEILRASQSLERGEVPPDFDRLAAGLAESLAPALQPFGHVFVHNVFTKHFNLPLTAALNRLLDSSRLPGCIAWCHDLSWTSPHSRPKVHPGYPWDLLRSMRGNVTYVTVSEGRRAELADLFGCPPGEIQVIYNGVDPDRLLGWSPEGAALVERLGLLESDLVLLMPVRVTQAKNIELALRVTADLKRRGLRPKLVVTGPPDPHDAESMSYFRSLLDLRRQLDLEAEAIFVYESGPEPSQPYLAGYARIGELLRASDAVFMPSHREGFGMPVLEAGLAGVPVVCAREVPAAREIGREEVLSIDPGGPPGQIAGEILEWLDRSPAGRLRRRVRQGYTWQAIFKEHIEPLVRAG